MRQYREDQYILMATAFGLIKKVALTEFSRPRTSGIIAISLQENDHLIGVGVLHANQEVMLFTNAGKAIRFLEKQVRPMGRQAQGVRGIRLKKDQRVVSLVAVSTQGDILAATEHGYGKRTPLSDYPVKSRGGQGVIAIQANQRNGKMVGAIQVHSDDEVMLITDKGTLVRVPVKEISLIGRNTQGVRLIQLSESEELVSLERVVTLGEGEGT